MLGVLMSIITIFIYFKWWNYGKELVAFCKRDEVIPKQHFYLLIALNFLTITPVLWGIAIVISQDFLHVHNSNSLKLSFFVIFAMVTCYDFYLYKLYSRALEKEKSRKGTSPMVEKNKEKSRIEIDQKTLSSMIVTPPKKCLAIANSDDYDGWKVKVVRTFEVDEISAITKAEVVSSENGKSVCFFMKFGGQTYIPLSIHSRLCVGDTFDLSTGKVLILSRKGYDDITRVEE